MRRSLSTRTTSFGVLMLFASGVLLSGIASASRWLMLGGYLLTVAAWWALARPPLTTRRLNWPWRRRP
jgi:hypothetical protein